MLLSIKDTYNNGKLNREKFIVATYLGKGLKTHKYKNIGNYVHTSAIISVLKNIHIKFAIVIPRFILPLFPIT